MVSYSYFCDFDTPLPRQDPPKANLLCCDPLPKMAFRRRVPAWPIRAKKELLLR